LSLSWRSFLLWKRRFAGGRGDGRVVRPVGLNGPAYLIDLIAAYCL